MLLPLFGIIGPTRIPRLLIWLIKNKLYSTKIIPLENIASKVFNGIIFMLFYLYFIGQIDGYWNFIVNENIGSDLLADPITMT